MNEALLALRIINGLLTTGVNVRAALEQLEAAQAASGGSLTDEDLVALARQARETWGKM